MVRCSSCNTIINVDDAKFCSNCGSSLTEIDPLERDSAIDEVPATDAVGINRDTDPVADDNQAALIPRTLDTTLLPSVPPLGKEFTAIRVKIGSNLREMVLPLDRTIHIGRRDPSLDLFPEIDVTNDGELAKTVSRRHAKISKQENLVIIVDEGSVNGTFVNEKRLKAFAYTVLHSDDVVYVGKLQIAIELLLD